MKLELFSSKPKVLFLHDRPSGGAGESLFQMIYKNELWLTKAIVFTTSGFLRNKFRKLEPKVKIIIQAGSSWLGSIGNSKWLYFPTRLWGLRRSLEFFTRVKFLVEQQKIDIIHSNSIKLMVGGYLARKKGLVHLVQVRELVDLDYYKLPLPKRLVLTIVSRYSDRIVANSHRTRQALTSLGVEEEKISVIHNAVAPPQQNLDIREKLNLDSNQKIVAVVGWITPNKMIEDFLEIAKHFQERKDLSFLVIGGKGNNQDYNAKIDALGRPLENVIFTGLLPDATSYMASFDLLICTCYTESFGRTVAEALIAGTPAIGVKECAVGEIIDHGETGYLTDKSNIKEFVEFTETIMANDALRESMSELGPKRMEARFGLSVIREKYLELYYKLLNQHKHV